ncbi:MAG: polysaccharide biosynthesis/export family protein [Phycisphaerae bacterium]|nr:polysaccharide biosynthesis/export family protein [Phycisphaerae bacterium]
MNARIRQGTWMALLATATLLSAIGCDVKDEQVTEQNPYPEDFLRKEWPSTKTLATRTKFPPYCIREGDALEIIYFVSPEKIPHEYTINIRDVIGVRFPFNSELDVEEAEVQSDGQISLPLVQEVSVAGRTIREVQSELEQRYAEFMHKPKLTVSMVESKREIDDLREAITTSPRGQSRLVPVTPGGEIALPLIGSVRAGGFTVDQVRDSIQKRYEDIGVQELQVTVDVETVSPLRVYVMGEVKSPGLVFNTLGGPRQITEMSLLQAISQAGSYIPARAELSKVLLIRSTGLPSPEVAVINLFQLFENQARKVNGKEVFVPDNGRFRRDIWLEDGDVIYVPTKTIAKRADYIEYVWTKGIYAVVPLQYNITANYNAVDNVDWLGPNP